MTNPFTIVACGDSAKDWQSVGYSIGVNDCWKWGKPTDALLVCNRPETFSKERQEIIRQSKPAEFYCNKATWSEWFPNWKKVRIHPWNGTLHQWPRTDGPSAYSYNTSPIIAITLAYNLGATEIIIWGVDLVNHQVFNASNPETKREVKAYLEVFEALKEKGVSVYRGADGGVFDEYLSKYELRQETIFQQTGS